MKYLPIIFMLLVASCSSTSLKEQVTATTIEAITGSKVTYNGAQCPSIKQRCGTEGTYNEWYQENGRLACACNN